MTLKFIIDIIEEFAPPAIQESWDNSGLIIGDKSREVTKILLALDCTPEVVESAVNMGAELVITHHPLIFKGIKRIEKQTNVGKAIINAIKNDIAIYSVHTNIDKILRGVSGLMAERIGLKNVEILSRDRGYVSAESVMEEGNRKATEIGLGVVGDMESPMGVEEFCSMVKDRFSLKILKTSKPIEGKISRVALCGGSGGPHIDEARLSGAQVYISGDISYHNFFCEDDFMIIDIGHYESEIGVLELLSDILSKKISNFAVHIENGANPTHYVF